MHIFNTGNALWRYLWSAKICRFLCPVHLRNHFKCSSKDVFSNATQLTQMSDGMYGTDIYWPVTQTMECSTTVYIFKMLAPIFFISIITFCIYMNLCDLNWSAYLLTWLELIPLCYLPFFSFNSIAIWIVTQTFKQFLILFLCVVFGRPAFFFLFTVGTAFSDELLFKWLESLEQTSELVRATCISTSCTWTTSTSKSFTKTKKNNWTIRTTY